MQKKSSTKLAPAHGLPRTPQRLRPIANAIAVGAMLGAASLQAQQVSPGPGPSSASDNVEEVIVTGAYTSNVVNLGKGSETLREIPQSITVITSQTIKDRNMLTLSDALKATTGVTVKTFGSGTFNYLMRGFELDAVSIDGVRTTGTSNGTHGHGTPDLISYESVEVMRGPAGLLEGAGEPGGYISLVRKKAHAERSVNIKGFAQSWPGYRLELDATGALTNDERLRARAAIGYEDSDSYIEDVSSQKKLFYTTIEYDLTPNLALAAGATIEDTEAVPDVGVPTLADGNFGDIDRDLYTGTPHNYKESRLARQFVEARYAFESGATVKATVTNADRDVEYLLNYTASPIDPVTGETARWALATDQDLSELSFDLHTNLPFTLFNQEHKLLLGVNGRDAENAIHGYYYDFDYPSINVYDPDSASNPDPRQTLTLGSPPRTTDTKENGAYFKATLALTDATNLILGGRLTTKWETDNGTSAAEINDEFTPNAGLVHDLSESISLYASISESFVPQDERNVNENVLSPRVGIQYEAGLKGELNGGRGNYHFAVFQITEDKRAIEDLKNPDYSIEGGEVQAEGFEMEIAGSAMDNLDLLAGYAYTDTEQIETGDPADKGKPFSSITPEHSLKLWGKYSLNSKLAFGLGAEYSSGTFSESNGIRWEENSYTIFSMMLSYNLNESTRIVLNGTNLTDEEYYARVQGGSRQNYFGDPRQFTVSIETSL
ncbi:TonB-dependent siderophore receptor [Parahaliea mediterranea]|uniref:TonB-dependent siderophore receptor n=1 Tax=Parahaliea mediterranea TaxID=651086 RepID=A0A939IMS6_9GAMM|nr:TonB-dependent siderophore receptor [Parahaliea mediterranea]MBN7797312.1 TonB-dependent siderophore receptor [Parahaliea mediterranea]